jgi:hypothetical protein
MAPLYTLLLCVLTALVLIACVCVLAALGPRRPGLLSTQRLAGRVVGDA